MLQPKLKGNSWTKELENEIVQEWKKESIQF